MVTHPLGDAGEGLAPPFPHQGCLVLEPGKAMPLPSLFAYKLGKPYKISVFDFLPGCEKPGACVVQERVS